MHRALSSLLGLLAPLTLAVAACHPFQSADGEFPEVAEDTAGDVVEPDGIGPDGIGPDGIGPDDGDQVGPDVPPTCVGAPLAFEVCDNGLDDDCDGVVDGPACEQVLFVAQAVEQTEVERIGSMAQPFATLGDALTAATGDTSRIVVASGVYAENLPSVIEGPLRIEGGYLCESQPCSWARDASTMSRLALGDPLVFGPMTTGETVLEQFELELVGATTEAVATTVTVLGSPKLQRVRILAPDRSVAGSTCTDAAEACYGIGVVVEEVGFEASPIFSEVLIETGAMACEGPTCGVSGLYVGAGARVALERVQVGARHVLTCRASQACLAAGVTVDGGELAMQSSAVELGTLECLSGAACSSVAVDLAGMSSAVIRDGIELEGGRIRGGEVVCTSGQCTSVGVSVRDGASLDLVRNQLDGGRLSQGGDCSLELPCSAVAVALNTSGAVSVHDNRIVGGQATGSTLQHSVGVWASRLERDTVPITVSNNAIDAGQTLGLGNSFAVVAERVGSFALTANWINAGLADPTDPGHTVGACELAPLTGVLARLGTCGGVLLDNVGGRLVNNVVYGVRAPFTVGVLYTLRNPAATLEVSHNTVVAAAYDSNTNDPGVKAAAVACVGLDTDGKVLAQSELIGGSLRNNLLVTGSSASDYGMYEFAVETSPASCHPSAFGNNGVWLRDADDVGYQRGTESLLTTAGAHPVTLPSGQGGDNVVVRLDPFVSGSVALDPSVGSGCRLAGAGDDSVGVMTDITGAPRPQGASPTPDVGALEVDEPAQNCTTSGTP